MAVKENIPQNCSLDLETWGIAPGCAIRSIGAVMFDPISGEIGNDFYFNIDDDSCIKAGLVKDEYTVKWWNKQSVAARDSLLVNQLPIEEVLLGFVRWFRKSKGIFVWSQGANFDEPIIQAAFRACDIEAPWRFWDVRDTRTAYEVARFNQFGVRRTGIYHNALDDARHQARCVQLAYANLYNGRRA